MQTPSGPAGYPESSTSNVRKPEPSETTGPPGSSSPSTVTVNSVFVETPMTI